MNFFTFLTPIFLSTLAFAFQSAPSQLFAGSTYSGHEEITRQALNHISKKIKDLDPSNTLFDLDILKYDLSPEPKGLFGYKARNLVISGNFASDFPAQVNSFNLRDFWKNQSLINFEDPQSQVLHFLRNYLGTTDLDSAYSTCMQARENIKYITSEALKAWDNGEKSKSLFLIGHASHTIQDSFSKAHTFRLDDQHNNNIKDICFFGANRAKFIEYQNRDTAVVCYHETLDNRDAVWNISPDQYKESLKNWGREKSIQCDKNASYPENEFQKDSCLTDEARLARVATEKYLFLVFNQLTPFNMTKSTTENFLSLLDSNLFDGPVGNVELDQKMPQGIIRCDDLSSEIIYGVDFSGNGS